MRKISITRGIQTEKPTRPCKLTKKQSKQAADTGKP